MTTGHRASGQPGRPDQSTGPAQHGSLAGPAEGAAVRRRGPSRAVAFFAVYKLLLRSVATTGRLVAIAALAAISVLTAIAVNASDPFDRLRTATGFVDGNLSTLVPVAVLVFGSATLGDLVDDGSLVYLWLRPVPARVHVLAAWAATMTVAVPLVGAPVMLATAMIGGGPDLMGATALALVLGIATYGAIFVMGGIRFRRALPWGLAYILIWEGFVASAGDTAARLAVRSYLRTILAQLTDQQLKLAEFNLTSGVLVPVAVTVIALAYASRRLARTDVA